MAGRWIVEPGDHLRVSSDPGASLAVVTSYCETVRPNVWIGTSGWHYKHWQGNFYPARLPAPKMLAHYWQQFDTVELNNSFYRLPKESALQTWRGETPEGFCFAAKGSRFLTHLKKLKDAEVGLKRFLDRIEILHQKLGPILFQLPPQWQVDHGRLEKFLKILPAYHRYVFEFEMKRGTIRTSTICWRTTTWGTARFIWPDMNRL